MIKFIKSFFAKKDETVVETAPYKIPESAATTLVTEQASQAVVESIAPAKKPAAKKPRAPKAVK